MRLAIVESSGFVGSGGAGGERPTDDAPPSLLAATCTADAAACACSLHAGSRIIYLCMKSDGGLRGGMGILISGRRRGVMEMVTRRREELR